MSRHAIAIGPILRSVWLKQAGWVFTVTPWSLFSNLLLTGSATDVRVDKNIYWEDPNISCIRFTRWAILVAAVANGGCTAYLCPVSERKFCSGLKTATTTIIYLMGCIEANEVSMIDKRGKSQWYIFYHKASFRSELLKGFEEQQQ